MNSPENGNLRTINGNFNFVVVKITASVIPGQEEYNYRMNGAYFPRGMSIPMAVFIPDPKIRFFLRENGFFQFSFKNGDR